MFDSFEAEPYHQSFIDVYRESRAGAPFVLVRAGADLPRSLEDEGVVLASLELISSQQSLNRGSYRWGRSGILINRDLQTRGSCVVSEESIKLGRRRYFALHGGASLVGAILLYGLAAFLLSDRSGFSEALKDVISIGSALIGAFMGWEAGAAFEEDSSPDHLRMDYRSRQFPDDKPPG